MFLGVVRVYGGEAPFHICPFGRRHWGHRFYFSEALGDKF
jgi:hypothetical protein